MRTSGRILIRRSEEFDTSMGLEKQLVVGILKAQREAHELAKLEARDGQSEQSRNG